MAEHAFMKFYPADWLADQRVALMTPAQKGVYIDLLCHAWAEGSIPSDPQALAYLLRLPRREFGPLWEVVRHHFEWTKDASRLTNRRVETEREKAREKSELARNNAKLRWSTNANAYAEPMPTADAKAMLPEARSKKLEARSKKEKELSQVSPGYFAIDTSPAFGAQGNTPTLGLKSDPPAAQSLKFDFDAIYAEYPRKEGKKRGIARCVSVIKTRLNYDALLQAVRNYSATVSDIRYAKHFDTFMGCWEDYVDAGTLTPRQPQAHRGAIPPREAVTEDKTGCL